MDAEEAAITIGWKLPTSTGGKTLTATKVLMRTGEPDAPWVELVEQPISAAEMGGQCSYTATGLTVGSKYSFKVLTVVEGLPGVESKTLEKSADGKHPLALLAPKKKDDGKKGGGGGGGGAGGKKGAKSKVVAKTGGMMTQWDILRAMGLSVEECVPFTDPTHWLRFFPPLGKKDLKRFGCGIDWRRTFITTDYNKYYDAFVRWQFYKLREADVIAFGKRPSIYSEADGQPCMDHDRDKGEGVGNQEYTALKLKVLEPLPACLAPLQGKTIFCLAGTLRPETMSGQTNCWILPEGDYGAFDAGGDVVYVCAARAARNMGFQDIMPSWGSPKQLLSVKGSQLLGTALKAPATSYEKIYMLPLTTILMNKGTAIVTSVPSDSPADYAAFMDLKNPKKREFYGVKAEWVEPFEPIEIIETEVDGAVQRCSAKYMCEKLKIQSQNDVEKLEQAKEVVYNAGFYKGTMIHGAFKGLSVQEAKPKAKQKMIDDKEAFTYYEPDGLATPRSTPDVECVVALVDQWYLRYGEAKWKAKVGEHLKKMECYNPAVQKAFADALDWLGGWACSRSFGLGTRMPWDDKFLIESLSDSTIYMAFYSVAHLLQGGEMFGQEAGPAGVKPEQCTTAFFDYIFFDAKYDKGLGVAQPLMDKLRREFRFWYPMDMRVSGKDLIPNHLTMSLYNHAAVWGAQPDMWPRSIYCNGHVQVDAEKMSKSKGNFITMEGAIGTWGADATRFTCADAGDGVENANYDRVVADRTILTLTTELEWITATLKGTDKGGKAEVKLREKGAPGVWLDEWFANEMVRLLKLVEEKYKAMRFKEALKVGFYNFQEARNRYRTGTAHVGVREDLLRQWAEWQAIVMAPITPHWSEELWELLGKPGCVVTAKWPTPAAAESAALTAAGSFLFDTAHSLSAALANRDKKKKGKEAEPSEKPNQINLYVASKFPRWKEIVLDMLRAHYDPAKGEVDKAVLQLVTKNEELNSFNKGKQVPQFAAMMREEANVNGAAALSLTMPFDEAQVLRENTRLLCSAVGVAAVHVYTEGVPELPEPELMASAAPGKPQPHFFHDANIRPSPPVAPPPAAAGLTPLEYVEKHQLAVLLNTAINEVARVQPADPAAWISEWLAKQKK